MSDLGWYVRRLSRMGPAEIGARVRTAARIRAWRGRAGEEPGPLPTGLRFRAVLPAGVLDELPARAVARLTATADRLLDGRAEYFGVERVDLVDPDWSLDPRTGRRAPSDVYCFDVRYRDEAAVGDIKQIWEPSRHQHLTVLAAAYAATRDERYAQRVADHLKSWWAANPPLKGAHWASGIELGIRLLSWVWVRRLLDGWPGAAGLFEENPEAVHQIRCHQRWLQAFPSSGSSANNHVIAESAGALAAACAFDWFPESARWRAAALRGLDTHLAANTFPSGLNRELATEYHGLVLELGLAAVVEAEAAGLGVPGTTWGTLRSMVDALAAVVDTGIRPPRQGDADDGLGILLDGQGTDRWQTLLHLGDVLFGRLPWWPGSGTDDVTTPLLTALVTPRSHPAGRPPERPAELADAGLTLLRARTPAGAEIWCRCDGGPHGFGSIAAHAHADALAVEVRHDGVDVLADPGTYCYHGRPQWRSYFRSTAGHNTLELDGADQSVSGGPFLWTRHARTRVVTPARGGRWCAEHDGYSRRGDRVVHRRIVRLDETAAELRVVDEVRSGQTHGARLSWHLGPEVEVRLAGATAALEWPGGSAAVELPAQLGWSAHRGESEPPLGWYSPGFGRRQPSWTLVGRGHLDPGAAPLTTVLRFGTATGATAGLEER